jgi:hypothetical protein
MGPNRQWVHRTGGITDRRTFLSIDARKEIAQTVRKNPIAGAHKEF